MAIPAVGVANWIKIGSTAASYSTGTVTIANGAVTAATGTIIKTANYADDIRDFLVAVLDRVFVTHNALASGDKPTTFNIQRALTGTQVQYVVTVNIAGDVDFPTWA
jgi:hypothetical protein